MRKTKTVLLIVALLLAVVMTASIGTYGWYRLNHVKVDGEIYDRHATHLDLREKNISEAKYLELCNALPETKIIWDVPFQGQRYSQDIKELTVTELSDADILMLEYLPELSYVDATQCRDYDAIAALREKFPQCQVDFYIHMGDEKLEENIDSLKITAGQVTLEDLQAALPHLPALSKLHFEDPDIPAADILSIQEQYPEVTVTWDKPILGENFDTAAEELDLSGKVVANLQEVETAVSYYPNLTKLVMVDCELGNDEMAAFRERARDKFQVIWGVQVGQAYLRTDDIGFIPSNKNLRVRDDELENLKYCEGLIAVDLGHTGLGNLSWVTGTPHLKYLIVGDGNVFNESITHLSCLKELEFLEIFMCPVSDISPLAECTSLKDLNLSETYVREVEPLTKLTNLEHLWMLNNHLGSDTKEYLQQYLPNTQIEVGGGGTCHGRGWRQMDSYYAMRDALGMWYMKG